jgi:tRNA (guanine-N7-)-methyltransferase
MPESDIKKRDIRSYVIREGRMTPGQKRALVEQWTTYGLNLEDGLIDLAFNKESGENPLFEKGGDIILEIGFGMGDSLFEMAQIFPDKNFIGAEVHRPGVGHLLQLAASHELKNLRAFQADSIDVLSQCIPDESLSKVQIFFPDPWHKKKHHKRRLITKEFVALVREKLKLDGILHIATDWAPYAEVIDEVMQSWTPCEIPKRVETKYERRGLKLEHEVFDMAFKKN